MPLTRVTIKGNCLSCGRPIGKCLACGMDLEEWADNEGDVFCVGGLHCCDC